MLYNIRHTKGAIIALVAGALFVVSPAHAQEVSADTGRMLPAYVDWTPYRTPGMCVAAGRDIENLTNRLGWRDTLARDVGHDTLSTATVRAVRECLRQFTPENVTPRDLQSLLWGSLQANDDEKAQAVVNFQVARVHSVKAQAATLDSAIQIFFASTPPRLTLAQHAIARLEALGDSARAYRVNAYYALQNYYYKTFDSDREMAEGERILALSDSMSDADFGDIYQGKRIAVQSLFYRFVNYEERTPPNLAAYQATIERGLARMEKYPALIPQKEIAGLRQLAAAWADARLRTLGTPVPQMSGKYIYNGNGATSFPQRGVVSLMVQLSRDRRHPEAFTTEPAQLAELRRVYKKYGKALQIIVFAQTFGYTPGSLVQTPAEEAESLRKFLVEDQQLPVTLVIAESPVIVAPDGRRTVQRVEYQKYLMGRFFQALIVGKDGTYQRFLNGERGKLLDLIIDQVLAHEIVASDSSAH